MNYNKIKMNHFLLLKNHTKNMELILPQDKQFIDNYGKKRDKCRYNWWDKNSDIAESFQLQIPHNYKTYND